MNDAFIYGYAVEGENFTDRKAETKRLKANFEHGVNTLLISNRRIGFPGSPCRSLGESEKGLSRLFGHF